MAPFISMKIEKVQAISMLESKNEDKRFKGWTKRHFGLPCETWVTNYSWHVLQNVPHISSLTTTKICDFRWRLFDTTHIVQILNITTPCSPEIWNNALVDNYFKCTRNIRLLVSNCSISRQRISKQMGERKWWGVLKSAWNWMTIIWKSEIGI